MSGKRMFHTVKEAAARGPHDEYPMLPPDIDPQLTLGRSDCPQPFFLVLQKDSVLVQMSGEGRVDMRATSVLSFALRPGDFVYVPGGVPHRLVPASPSVHYRFRAARADSEAVAWFCQACDAELARYTWDAAASSSHLAFDKACRSFNAAEAARRCGACGAVHPSVDIDRFRWTEIAREVQGQAGAP